MATKPTDPNLDRALKNAGYHSNGGNTYTKPVSPNIYTDDNYFKKSGGDWKKHFPGKTIK